MAAIPRELIESELSATKKGARFHWRAGAHRGTVFQQARGRHALPGRDRRHGRWKRRRGCYACCRKASIRPSAGRTSDPHADVRIIAATHRELKSQIQQGLFREDLYYRLNVVPLRLPPLRERLEDVGDLVRHFLRVAAKAGLGHKSIETAAIERLKRYHWPGNVRELENMVRGLRPASEDTLTGDIVEAGWPNHAAATAEDASRRGTCPSGGSLSGRAISQLWPRLPRPGSMPILHTSSARYCGALAPRCGTQIRAAALLGLNRNPCAEIRDPTSVSARRRRELPAHGVRPHHNLRFVADRLWWRAPSAPLAPSGRLAHTVRRLASKSAG